MARVTIYPKCDDIVAHLTGVRSAVTVTAEEGASRARAVLSAHRFAGHSQITVTRGSLDSFVNLDDTRGDHAAAAIEFGRTGKNGSTQGVNALGSAF